MNPVSELGLALEHARRRTEALLEPLSDEQLTRQVSPLQSPLVWDLAHIGHFEELWLLRNGDRLLATCMTTSTTRSLTHARARPAADPVAGAKRARTSARCASACSNACRDLDPFARPGWSCSTSSSTPRRWRRRSRSRRCTVRTRCPEVEPSGDVLVPAGPFTLGARDRGHTTTSGRRTSSSCRPSGSTAHW